MRRCIVFYFPSFLTFTAQTSSYFVHNPYGWQFQKIWIDDKKSFSLTKSVLHDTFRWQICHRKCCFCMKKAAMTFLMSLLLYFNVPWGNRTLNCLLGVRVTLVTTCYLMSTKSSIYQESRHLIENPCQYKIIETNRFLMFSVSSLLAMLTYGIN